MTECAFCHDSLRRHEELHAVQGLLFCSQECATEYFTVFFKRAARKSAEDLYNDTAEIVLSCEVLADEQGY